MNAAYRAFLRGLTDSVSIAVGYVPVAISFGLTAIHADITPMMAIVISLLVYAGASQFILVSLVASGSAPLSIVGIVLLMNLRHFFYGPALLSKFGGVPRRYPMIALAAGLTDEVFAASISKMQRQPERDREPWYLGVQLGAYASWVGGTAAGAYFGQDWLRHSPILSQSLGFVLPALFLALLLEIRQVVAVNVLVFAGLATLGALFFMPAYGAIMTGMAAGALAGARR
ncbi:MAG TPA: AzlC family ABC transporter permease [Burkholderiaceae bacterium]|jgi:4-azaleucine resistance transporter AzlC|nr:AzlC family ABC transporter permease [Burkholderiaceae bacterium]